MDWLLMAKTRQEELQRQGQAERLARQVKVANEGRRRGLPALVASLRRRLPAGRAFEAPITGTQMAQRKGQ